MLNYLKFAKHGYIAIWLASPKRDTNCSIKKKLKELLCHALYDR